MTTCQRHPGWHSHHFFGAAWCFCLYLLNYLSYIIEILYERCPSIFLFSKISKILKLHFFGGTPGILAYILTIFRAIVLKFLILMGNTSNDSNICLSFWRFSVLNFLIASCYFVKQNCLYFSFKMVISEICTCS